MDEERVETKLITKHLKGSTAAILSYDDPISFIKTLVEFTKMFDLPKVKAAIIEGVFTTDEQIEDISKLPTKDQLLTQIVATMTRQLSGFVTVLKGSQRKCENIFSRIPVLLNIDLSSDTDLYNPILEL